MISKKMCTSLNGQITNEIYSAHLYLSMSAYFSGRNLTGFANWMRIQYQEEMVHAFKIYDYIIGQGGQVKVAAVAEPVSQFESAEAAFAATGEHERKVTAMINKLVDQAIAEKDHATGIFLQWFVTEQIEEESSAEAILQQIKMLGDKGPGLMMLDRELGQRVFTPPPTAGKANPAGKAAMPQ